jgi:hypothetical protein
MAEDLLRQAVAILPRNSDNIKILIDFPYIFAHLMMPLDLINYIVTHGEKKMKSHIKQFALAVFAVSSMNMGISVSAHATQIYPYPTEEECPDFFQRNCSDGRYLKLSPTSNLYRLCAYCSIFVLEF